MHINYTHCLVQYLVECKYYVRLLTRWHSDKESTANAGDTRNESSGLGRSPGGGHGNPLHYSFRENPWTEEPGGLQSMGESDTTEHAHNWKYNVNAM